jgi:NhaP-type Na+/H+ or K+/H+ antiporter
VRRSAGRLAALDVGLESPALQIAATLSLALILFTDALSLDLREAREHRALALLALGPGHAALGGAVRGGRVEVLGFSAPGAAILGAALAVDDPVLLEGAPAPQRAAGRGAARACGSRAG